MAQSPKAAAQNLSITGVYVNGWFSQSLHNPGLDKTFGNEIDATLGWSGVISEKWSVDVHGAYYDLANAKLLSGTNGDLAAIGGTLKYHLSDATSAYVNVESYYGLGQNGFPNGQKIGIGVYTSAMGASVDASVYHNEHFFGQGEFLKISVEPVNAVAKVFGGEVRPNLQLWQPVSSSYAKNHGTQVMVGLRINW